MASRANNFSYFLIAFFLNDANTLPIHFNMPKIDEEDYNMTSHLKYHTVYEYCTHRDDACLSNNLNLCAMRMTNGRKSYKDFKNSCYLFLDNMCDHPEYEYFIVTSGTCEEYLARRVNNDEDEVTSTPDDAPKSAEIEVDENRDNDTSAVTEDPALRQKKSTLSTLYDIDTSYDGHICPHSCPNVYSPECVNVNRGFGMYFKMLNFVNHCVSDIYYCKHWQEFAPPPNEAEMVRSSPLSWSFCGSSRYLQFARFAEVTSSLGYYGWLHGDQKYSHIMEPHEREQGYG